MATTVRFMNYRGHVIYFDTDKQVYLVAIKRDGTDEHYIDIEDVYKAIDDIEDNRRKRI